MHLPVFIRHFLQSHKQSNLKAFADPRIAENLHTDKKEEDEEEGEGDDGDKEEVAIGKERMSRIQSMFSGEKKNMEEDEVLTSPSCTDFNELLDEGWILCLCVSVSKPKSTFASKSTALCPRSGVSQPAPVHKRQPAKDKPGLRKSEKNVLGHGWHRQEAHRSGRLQV